MKIGIDASRYGHKQATGVEFYSFYIINELLKRFVASTEHEVILYSKEPIEHPAASSKGFYNKIIKAKRFWTLRALSKEMKENPPDLLFVPSHTLPLSLPSKSVIMIHDTAFRHLKSSYSFLQYHYLNWSTKFAVKNATHIIVPSEATKADLVSDFACPKSKITVVQHGFDRPSYSKDETDKIFDSQAISKILGIRKDLPYFFFIGRLESKKNLKFLVEAFSIFSKKYPEYSLVLAGKPGLGFKKIKHTIEKLNLSGKVFMPGYISDEQKAALYANASAFLFPSLYEGFGFPILESFYYKTPVISSNLSSMPEIGGNAVEYVDPYDKNSLANAIETIVKNSNYAEELVELGENRLRDFSWGKAGKKTLEILLNC